jgi:hypothetical protein
MDEYMHIRASQVGIMKLFLLGLVSVSILGALLLGCSSPKKAGKGFQRMDPRDYKSTGPATRM